MKLYARRVLRSRPRRTAPAPGLLDVDLLYVSDLRFPGGTSTSLVEELDASLAAGYSVALLHLQSTSLSAERPFHPALQALVDDGRVSLLVPGRGTRARLVVVKHPTVMARSLGGRLPVDAESVVVAAGQVPVDPDGTVHYHPATVDANVVEALGHRPTWAPVGPEVRARLAAAAELGGIELSADDWVEVIDTTSWSVDRRRSRSGGPVIGRHSRPSPLKWPATAEELLAAYPDEPPGPGAVRVRVLGGSAGAAEVLGREPAHWQVLEFGAMPAREFLAGIDVYVYFHHPEMVEAFGRGILEALASGAVVVLAEHFRSLFGEACIYAVPADVRRIVVDLHADHDAYLAQSERGRRVVEQRFSHAAHVARLRTLIGPPAGGSRPVAAGTAPSAGVAIAPGWAAQLQVVLVVGLEASPRQVEQAVRRLGELRDRSGTFVPVVASTMAPPPIAADLGVAFETVTSRANWKGAADRWPEYAQRRVRGIARTHGARSIVPLDLAHPDSRLVLGVRLPLAGTHQDDSATGR